MTTMTITNVTHVKVVDGEPVFIAIADGKELSLTLARRSAFELLNGLVYCGHAIHRNDSDGAVTHGPQYEVVDCRLLTTESGGHGITVRTREGFEFPLVLSKQMRQLAAACIEQIDNPTPPRGVLH